MEFHQSQKGHVESFERGDSRGDIESVEIAINQTRYFDPTWGGEEETEKEGEKEPGQEKARSVVTLDDNLSRRSGSLRDLDTKIFLPFMQWFLWWAKGQVLSIVAGSSSEIL